MLISPLSTRAVAAEMGLYAFHFGHETIITMLTLAYRIRGVGVAAQGKLPLLLCAPFHTTQPLAVFTLAARHVNRF